MYVSSARAILLIVEHPSTPPTVSLTVAQPDLLLLELIQNLAGVKELVQLTADISRIPTYLLPTKVGVDGCTYYDIRIEIQVTYYSAYTTYELIHDGINYGIVASEYV